MTQKESPNKEKIAESMKLLMSGKRDEAEEALKALNNENPDDIVIKQNLSVALYQNGKADEAAEVLKACIDLKPNEFSNYHNLGLIYERMNKKKEAKHYYIKATKLDKKAHISFTRLGQIFFDEGNYVESLKAYQAILGINGPNAFSANLGKGLCLSRLGYKKEAKKCLEIVTKQKPEYESTKEALAFLYLDLGNYKEGRKIFREINGEILFNFNEGTLSIS